MGGEVEMKEHSLSEFIIEGYHNHLTSNTKFHHNFIPEDKTSQKLKEAQEMYKERVRKLGIVVSGDEFAIIGVELAIYELIEVFKLKFGGKLLE